MRFEFAVVALLLLTIGAIRFADAILSSDIVITADRASAYPTRAHGDQQMGGSSTVAVDARHPLTWSCRLGARYADRFCGYEILFDKGTNRGIDLRRFQTIALTIDYRGPTDSIRLHLKNFDPAYSDPKIRGTLKFNQVELPVAQHVQRLDAKLSDFAVPEWWVQRNHIPFRYSRPQLDNVVALQISTGNNAHPGLHRFRISRIALHGSVLTMDQWYLGMLGCWILLICLFLVSRIVDLQHDLARRRALQDLAVGEAQRAREFARRDHLTGLFNRLGATDRYQQMTMTGAGRPVAIMLIDVDHFKSINDRFGHTTGDAVLSAFAAVLRDNVRDDDLIGRWGGEEFLLVCRVHDEKGAFEVADKLRGMVENSDFGVHGALTASFGVYFCKVAPDSLGGGVTCADHALYAAKEQGRNRVILYRPPAEREPARGVAETDERDPS